MDTPLMIVAALSLVALPLAARLLVAVQQGWRPKWRRAGEDHGGAVTLRVTARVQLSPQHSLHVVEAGGRTMLVACSPGGVRLLQRTRRQEAPAGLASAARAR